MTETKTLKGVEQDPLGASCWTYDAAEAAGFSLVAAQRTCRLSFQDHLVVSYTVVFRYVDETDYSHEERTSQATIDVALGEFACGSSAHPPDQHVLSVARRLSEAVIASTIEPEITVDVDGALAFDLRLKSGLLMFAELQADGSLSITVFDDSGQDASVANHLPSATERQFLDLLQSHPE